jgi:hypothetical protein
MARTPIRMPTPNLPPVERLKPGASAAEIEAFTNAASVGPAPEVKKGGKPGRPPRPQKLVHFTMALPDTLMQQVTYVAQQTGLPKRAVIEQAVKRYMAQEVGKAKRRARALAAVSE